MNQTYTILMRKRDDALARLYGFMSGRALYISGSSADATEDDRYWRVTVSLDTKRTSPEKFLREINRLLDVESALDGTPFGQ